ncbi:uncharacterized protein MYCFIDRAFT_84398 [Pseudocercospora fijiensis CIRAD86]|uniref:Uncharacterized protein n=1 Tax=Pseudocercospora fijiensis (strain CIRAD86) TaxID=383855 RepID=M2ZZE0_PSEFD|nr:uncharacterized protein MYCFIDRAFT_84398 [Pseudocercospora fijiensis CIRAD86]EME77531.1 hypothetical protein MYCFIDRAFT_84398 [Pseudocercospora fijiensis CIRAD86]
MPLFWTARHSYSELASASDDLEAEEKITASLHSARRYNSAARYFCYAVALAVAGITSCIIDRTLLRSHTCDYSPQFSDARSPSPFLALIDRSWHTETFSELNFNKPYDSEYTRPATLGDDVAEEVDRYWADLGAYEAERLLPEEYGKFHDIGPQHNHSLTSPANSPYTPYTGYPVEIQVAHMLHCLNLVRQGQWYNFDYYRKHSPSFGENQWKVTHGQSIIEAHSAHCIEQLRQYLMCDVDIRLVPFGDLDDNEIGPQPIFAQKKQCRNFDSFWRWFMMTKWDQNPKNHGVRGHVPPVISFSGLKGTFHE